MIDVAFVNTSKRTVAITSATIEWEGYTAGRVNRFVPGLGSLDPRPLAARLADAARPPLALASGEAFTGSVVWTDYTDGTSAPGITEAVDRYLSADRTGGQEPDGKLEVKLAVSPGLDETQDVRLTIGDDQLEELAGPPMGDWPATLVLEPSSGEVNGIAVYGRTLTMGTVEIWGERPDPMAKVTRPLLAGRRTVFPIADLPPGRYLWTLTAGEGGPVSGGELETPCPDPGSREVEPRRCEPADG